MASWLKAAEDLLEVVDRRAKRVVGELSEEQSGLQHSGSNGDGSPARMARSKEKGRHSRVANNNIAKKVDPEREDEVAQISGPTANNEKPEILQSENSVEPGADIAAEESKEVLSDTSKGNVEAHVDSTGTAENDIDGAEVLGPMEVPVTKDHTEFATNSTSDDVAISDSNDIPESGSALKWDETITGDQSSGADLRINSVDGNTSTLVEQKLPGSEAGKEDSTGSNLQSDGDVLPDPSPMKKQLEHKSDASPMKIQEQLDEAQDLLKAANATGQSKEARLAKICHGLSSRLQEYKAENEQLEELLVAERELSSSYEARIRQLQQELSASKREVARVESSMSDALAAKNSEIESLVSSLDALKKQSSTSEGKLASLQANMEDIMRGRELTETRMMQALREEIASAEHRAEEERAAHNATKLAAIEREVELEHRALEASNALARIQRAADDSQSRAMDLEHKLALLEVENSTLNQKIEEMEASSRRTQKKTSEEANQILQAWKEEAERAHQGQRDAENKLSSLEAELQKMRVEMAGMKRDAEHYSKQEHMELEKRYRELTDLLYHKQTQLEAMASEKAAAEFQLEKEAKRFQEAQAESERIRASRRASSLWDEDTDLKELEPLPLHHRHMAAANIQLQKAAKLLDSGAVRATRFLWRYPVARVILLFYLVFVHLFLMYLLHRLQVQADDSASRELAAQMGFKNTNLP